MQANFSPISVYKKDFSPNQKQVSRKRQPFNDKRLYSVYTQLSEQMQQQQQIVVNQISESASRSASFYRFYGNDKVTTEELIKMNCTIDADLLSELDILCLGDSTSFNLSKRKGRIQDFDKLGVLQDGKTPGFHAHVNLALNAQDGSVVGLADVLYWNRPKGKVNNTALSPKQDKESYKWELGAGNSKKVLSSAKRLTFVFDREADDFALFSHIQKELESDFVIRAKHNRQVRWNGQICLLSECLANSSVAMVYEVELKALDHYSWTSGKRIKRAGRTAKLELRFESVEVLAPKKAKSDEVLHLTAIEVREVTENLPEGEQPLHWILWTTHQIESPEQAKAIVGYYLLRWDIEQLFRTLKKKGFNQEATELETLDAIVKQTTMAFKTATTVLQLVNARNLPEAPPIEYVFDEKQQIVLNKVKERLEGQTDKQKNPFPSNQLSWAAWIIARLGGWKGYQSQKPPGPITMKRGLDKFYTYFEGYQLFDTS